VAKRSALYPQGAGAYTGGVGTLAQAQGNVLNPPGAVRGALGIDFSSAHTWAWLWFAGAVGFLLMTYFGHGGRRGGAM
jgi:hypothetical protein